MTWAKNFGFGSGFMFMTPTAPATNLTPIRIGVMQNVSVEISFDEKPLYGTNQFPEAVARGKAKATCSCEFAQIDSQAIGNVFFGTTPIVGEDVIADLEAATLTSSTTHAIQHSGTDFVSDLGVFYAATGQPLNQTSSGSEAAAWYSVSATGVYQFATADSIAALLFSYKYTTLGAGDKASLTNQPMGNYIPFQTDLYQNNPEVSGNQWGMRLYKCMSSKLTLGTKQDDWMLPKMDFSIYANPAGKVLDFNTPV